MLSNLSLVLEFYPCAIVFYFKFYLEHIACNKIDGWVWLNVFFPSQPGPIAITNPVPLYSDGAIKAGIPLVIGCNADAVGLDTQYITIVKLQIQRQLHSSQSRDTIAIYHPYSQFTATRPDPYVCVFCLRYKHDFNVCRFD